MINEYTYNEEYNKTSDQISALESIFDSEDSADTEYDLNSEYSQSESSATSSQSTLSYTAIVALLASITFVAAVVIGGISGVVANFVSLVAYGDSFSYDIVASMDFYTQEGVEFDEASVDDYMYLSVKSISFYDEVGLFVDSNNDATNPLVVTLVEEDHYFLEYNFVGMVEGLTPKTRYEIEFVISDGESNVTYAKEQIKTL